MTDEPKEILYPSKKGRHAFEIVEALGDVTLTILHNNILDETESTLWKSDWHYHSLCEIVVLCSGDEHILFEDQTFVAMNPHDICIIPKGLSHFCSPVGERQKRISLLWRNPLPASAVFPFVIPPFSGALTWICTK